MTSVDGQWPAGFPPGFGAKFTPERMIGRGSFGSVWLARQLPLDRRVALKILHDEVLADESEVGRFTDEARITAALHHPHVVVVMDHGVESGVPWIAYEYLEGPSLRARLPADGLPWRDALTAAVQVLDALDHAHQRGVLHRDIKPDNVIEVQPGHYKVADFGLARWRQTNTKWTATGAVVGSPAYMSPEQIDGLEPGPASDQYALGVALYELLTGKLPFYETPEMPVMLAHLKLPPPKPCDAKPSLPRVLDLVIERALAKRPADRWSSCRELRNALEQIVQGESSTVMVRLRKTQVKVRRSGKSAIRTPSASEAAVRRKPGPIWWATAILVPVIAASVYGVKVHRAREAARLAASVEPAPAPSPRPAFKELAVSAQPPRAVKVRWELERVPPGGWPLPVEVNGVARIPLKLASVAGSVVVSGIAPGSQVRIGGQVLKTPRALPIWIDVLPADRHASVFLRFLAPATVDVTVLERASGTIVAQQRATKSHRVLQRVTGLKPMTRYEVRVKIADESHFVPAALAEKEFQTLSTEELEQPRLELKSLSATDEAERVRAAVSLRNVPDPEAVMPAAAVLQEKKVLAEFDTTNSLLTALSTARDPRVLPAYAAALQAPAANRAIVIQNIGEIQDPAGFEIIERDCARPGLNADEETATTIAEALIACDPVRATSLFYKTSNELPKASLLFKSVAIEGLARLGGNEAVAALGRLARHAPRELGPRAAAGLGALGGEAARTELLALLSGGARPGEAGPATEAALRAIGRCGRTDDALAVIALLNAPLGARLKRAALTALAGLGGAEAEAEIARRVVDPDAGVAAAACWAAGQLRVTKAVPALVKRLKMPGGTSGRAPRALGAIGDAVAVGPLMELAGSRAVMTTPGQVLDRAEALWALGVIGDARALPVLLEHAKAGDLYTRYRAVEGLGWLGDPAGRAVLEAITRDPAVAGPFKEVAARSLKWLAEGRRERRPFFNVDPAFPPVRTGLILAMGETFGCDAQGLCLLDARALGAPADPASLPTGSRPAKGSLLGLIGAAGHCFAGRGDTAPCTRASEGELSFYALRTEPDDKAAGFFTVWLK